MINIWVHGGSGRTGSLVVDLARKSQDVNLVGSSSRSILSPDSIKGKTFNDESALSCIIKSDVIIDFSTPEASLEFCKVCKKAGFQGGYLLATTGFDEGTLSQIKKEAKDFKLLRAGNTSIGVFMMGRIAKTLTNVFSSLGYDIEISESHHRMKVDSPSGTAQFIADQIIDADNSLSVTNHHKGGRKEKSIGIHSIRGGQVFGEHTVHFLGDLEELSVTHKALSRDLFAKGAITLSKWVMKQKVGFYEFSDIDPNDFN